MKINNHGTRLANLKAMYNDILDGHTIMCEEVRYYIFESHNDPDYGKEYIRVSHPYGAWAINLSFRAFASAVRSNNKDGKGKFEYKITC